jgi:hypothetical protein
MNRAIISGALGNKPFNGGNAWSRVSWLLGFKRLGFEVCFVEEINRGSCVDPRGVVTDFANSVNLAYFKAEMAQFGLERSSSLICDDGQAWGIPSAELAVLARQADLLFNLSGHLTLSGLKNAPACRIYYDDDPGFTQFWHTAGFGGARLEGHDYYFTLGANIGSADFPIPASGIVWRHTRPPVVLEEWPDVGGAKSEVRRAESSKEEGIGMSGDGIHKAPPHPVALPLAGAENARNTFDRFTTIASWRGAYGPVEYGGKTYGAKCHEFRKFLEMPQRSGHPFEVALQIHAADQKDLDALRANDWRIADPKQVAGTTGEFRRYVQNSGAEFSVAQGIYVDTNSGWFSDRTVRYLASGRPALVQETGFSRHIPTGAGLISFRTMDEAIEGAHRIVREYEHHCRAARRVAEEYFDSDRVIRRLIDEVGLKRP